jgi:G3E family GTPase
VTAVLPAIVVGGYLGAGKTTLVNRLLREAGGRRIAVMVNDFGEIGIDADLIVSREDAVLNLAGGCVCCAVGSDLIEAVMALPQRQPAFDLVLVETSGVAMPGTVARSLRLAPGIEVDGVVVLADAEDVRERASDRYVGDTIRQQLADADLLVLNKVDLVDDAALAAVRDFLDGAAPRARRVEAIEAAVPADVVLGLTEAGSPPQSLARSGAGLFAGDPSARRVGLRRPRAAAQQYQSAWLALPDPTDVDRLARLLADPRHGVVRAKGVVRDTEGRAIVVQAVGPRVRATPAAVGSAAAGPGDGRLVVIGLTGGLDAGALAHALGVTVGTAGHTPLKRG